MANPIDSDSLAFTPFNGGLGVRIAVTDVASAAVGVPGGASDGDKPHRVRIVNVGSNTAFVRLYGGLADTSCMAMLPGTVEVFGAPYSNPSGVSISAIAAAGETTTLSVVAGIGS